MLHRTAGENDAYCMMLLVHFDHLSKTEKQILRNHRAIPPFIGDGETRLRSRQSKGGCFAEFIASCWSPQHDPHKFLAQIGTGRSTTQKIRISFVWRKRRRAFMAGAGRPPAIL